MKNKIILWGVLALLGFMLTVGTPFLSAYIIHISNDWVYWPSLILSCAGFICGICLLLVSSENFVKSLNS
jgi:hypothetical protein